MQGHWKGGRRRRDLAALIVGVGRKRALMRQKGNKAGATNPPDFRGRHAGAGGGLSQEDHAGPASGGGG